MQHTTPSKPQYAPHKWTVPVYGRNRQFDPDPGKTPLLPPKDIKEVQRVVGMLLDYGRAVDDIILPDLNEIAASQTKRTKKTVEN